MRRTSIFAVLIALNIFLAQHARAGIVVPTGLNPGDTYHLIFSTRTGTFGDTSFLSAYNNFVNNQAAQSSNLTGTTEGVAWFAVASTESDDARDNAVIGSNSPVYRMDGTTRVADGFNDFWDGNLQAAVLLDQFGNFNPNSQVWTGSDADGTKSTAPLGNQSFSFATWGESFSQSSSWMNSGISSQGSIRRIYALSQQLTVPPIPEPSAVIWLTGIFGITLARGRRQR